MAYADTLRTSAGTLEIAAGLIEGIASSTYPLTWSTWAPTYGASGSMTFTSVTTTAARYARIGKLVLVNFYFGGTTGGTASNYITMTLPVTAVGTSTAMGAYWLRNSTDKAPHFYQSSTTVLQFFNDAGANYTLTAGNIFAGSFVYEAA